MDSLIKSSIDGRRQAIYTAYEINNADIESKINDLFSRIEALGSSCSDSADFETKFATSPLNQEYINLFTTIATSCPAKTIEHSAPTDVKSNGEVIAENAASDLKYMADDLTSPMRHKAYQETYDAARDVPVLGEVMTAKQHFDFFSRFKKKKDNEEK